jgi:hypothetical protein
MGGPHEGPSCQRAGRSDSNADSNRSCRGRSLIVSHDALHVDDCQRASKLGPLVAVSKPFQQGSRRSRALPNCAPLGAVNCAGFGRRSAMREGDRRGGWPGCAVTETARLQRLVDALLHARADAGALIGHRSPSSGGPDPRGQPGPAPSRRRRCTGWAAVRRSSRLLRFAIACSIDVKVGDGPGKSARDGRAR